MFEDDNDPSDYEGEAMWSTDPALEHPLHPLDPFDPRLDRDQR